MHREHDPLQPRPLAAMLPTLLLFVLLLLTIMVVSPPYLVMHGPRLPTAKTAVPAMKARLTVGIDRDGMVWIEGVPDPGPIPDRFLTERLREAFAGRAGEELYLVADRNLEYVRVQRVIAAASEAGVREVQLIVACPRGRESLMRACRA
jgi:biopolymer transport protein ExbD